MLAERRICGRPGTRVLPPLYLTQHKVIKGDAGACFFYRLLSSADANPHPVSCTCANTLRYGTMEVESDEDTATLLSENFWACQTFAEAQEFFLMRLHARAFTQDLETQATLVTGLSVDQWPVHMRLPHKEKMRRLEFPADLLKGEEPIVEFPARIALATAANTARIQDLKAPVQTDPVRLTRWAHAKAQQTAIDLRGQPDEDLIVVKCEKLTSASTKKKTSRPMMKKYVDYVKKYWGDQTEDQIRRAGQAT